MGLARSTYYYRSRRRRAEEAELVKRIEAVRERWPAYGYRRVMHQLRHEGLTVNHKRIARLMRLHGLLELTRFRGRFSTFQLCGFAL